MKASDVMTAEVVTVPSKATIFAAASLMLDRHISGLPVVNDDGRLVEIVTEGDLFRRYEIGTEHDPSLRSPGSISNFETFRKFVKSHGRHVDEVMTRDVFRVFKNTPLAKVAALLELKRIKRVPVMDDSKIVGIVSRADLLRVLVSTPDSSTLAAGG